MPPRAVPGPAPLLAFAVVAASTVWGIGVAGRRQATTAAAPDPEAVPAWVGDEGRPTSTRISGQVVGAPGALVHLGVDLADPAAWTRTVTATPTGSFVIDALPTGRYQLWAEDAGRVSRVVTVDTAAGAGEGVELVVHPCRPVRGTITDPGQRPIAGATVEVGGHVVARADGVGVVSWCAPPRPVRAVARAVDRVPASVELAADLTSFTVALEPGRLVTVELPARADLVVEAGPGADQAWPVTVARSQFGPTRVRLPRGPGQLRLRRGRASYGVTTITADTTRVTLQPGPAQVPTDIPAQSFITGRVLIERAPVADAELIAVGAGGQVLGQAWSEPDGKYQLPIRGMVPGRADEVRVTARAAPSPLIGQRRLMVLPGGNLGAIDVRMVDPAARPSPVPAVGPDPAP